MRYALMNPLLKIEAVNEPLQGDCASAVQWGVLWGSDGSSMVKRCRLPEMVRTNQFFKKPV